MLPKIIRGLFFLLVGLAVLDSILANRLNKSVIARQADFEERLHGASLDFDRLGFQGCTVTRRFWVYVYQTCFNQDFQGAEVMDFLYWPAVPFFYFYDLTPGSYYFKESAYSAFYIRFNKSGQVTRTNFPGLFALGDGQG